MESVTSAVGRAFLVHRHYEVFYFAMRMDSLTIVYFALKKKPVNQFYLRNYIC